jgi:hypothetical protein
MGEKACHGNARMAGAEIAVNQAEDSSSRFAPAPRWNLLDAYPHHASRDPATLHHPKKLVVLSILE